MPPATPTDRKRLFRFGGAAFIIGGVLFFTRYVLETIAGAPPSSGAEIISWVEANRLALSLENEVLFFASVALVPGVIALYLSLEIVEGPLAAIGCGIVSVVVPVLAVLLIVHGRLVYPVYGLRVSNPAIAEFIVAVFYGGLHAVGLLLAGATLVLSLAMRRAARGAPLVALGFATAVGDAIGAYPDVVGPLVLFGCQVLFAAWFVAVGWALFTIYTRAHGSTLGPTNDAWTS